MIKSRERADAKRSLARRVAYASILLGTLLVGTELILRLFVPLSALVEGEEYFKAWYVENVDQLRTRERSEKLLSDPELGWSLRPDLELPVETTNSQGFRGVREFDTERTPGIPRGVFLGDSLTYGAYVGDDETYPARIGELLDNTEVLNLGVSGYGTDQILLRWLRDGQRYRPDFVVLGYYIDDFHRNTMNWRGEAPKPRFQVLDGGIELVERKLLPIEDLDRNEQAIRNEIGGLLRAPRVWTAAKFVWRRALKKMRGHREPAETFDEKAAITRGILRRLKSSCNEIGAKFAVVAIPMQFPDYPDENRIREVLAGACAEMRMPFLPLAKDLGLGASRLGPNRKFFEENGHWTPFGHGIGAAQILEFLRSAGFFE